jgi:N-acetylmuramic acid 6-phosphate etherase
MNLRSIDLARVSPTQAIMALEDHLLTESLNPRSESIDTLTHLDIVRLMNSEDARVVAAVEAEAEAIAEAIDWAAHRLQQGGRLIYVGAGTSGRLGVLDAAECPPTFGTPPAMVVGLIAGGPSALTRAIEGIEDLPERGATDIASLGVGNTDLVVGITTSGRTPYVLGAVREARRRGAATIGIAFNRPSLLGPEVDLEIAPLVGPEIISGSTRLKAGTATKMILNMISTGAMVRIGKTLGNRMVDLQPLNEKLRIRSRRILRELTGVDDAQASQILSQCGGQLKPALVMTLAGVDPATAQTLLAKHGGQVREAVKAAGRRGS